MVDISKWNQYTRDDLAKELGIETKVLCYYLYKLSPDRQYKTFEIPKKNGTTRTINAPTTNIKLIQRKLADILYSQYTPKMCSNGFEKSYTNNKNQLIRKGIVPNAIPHVKKRHIINVDLKNFFPSINFGRVRGLFMAEPYNFGNEVATTIAQICCCEGKLPQGAPTSPIISNMICRKMDNEILKLCRKIKCSYSRYADDLTFSTNLKEIPNEIFSDDSLGIVLSKIIENNGFEINSLKFRTANNKCRQTVTGLVVNKKVNVDRIYIRNIRALLHNWEKDGEEIAEQNFHNKYCINIVKKPKLRNVIMGRINFVKQVRGDDDEIFIKFWNKYYKILNKPEKLKQIIKEDDSILALISEGENHQLEFKQSMEYSKDVNKCIGTITYTKTGSNKKKLSPKGQILKTIVAFLNSVEGGTLLIGVEDSGIICGLAEDLKNCSRNNIDGLALKLMQWLGNGDIHPFPINRIHTKFYKVKDRLICKVHVNPYQEPVYLNYDNEQHLFVRNNVQTIEIKRKSEFLEWVKANNKIHNHIAFN